MEKSAATALPSFMFICMQCKWIVNLGCSNNTLNIIYTIFHAQIPAGRWVVVVLLVCVRLCFLAPFNLASNNRLTFSRAITFIAHRYPSYKLFELFAIGIPFTYEIMLNHAFAYSGIARKICALIIRFARWCLLFPCNLDLYNVCVVGYEKRATWLCVCVCVDVEQLNVQA